MDEHEKRLIQRIRSGDGAACAELVRAHYAPIYRLLVHLTRDAHRGEDLCQETFAAAWRKFASFNGRSSLRTWLHRIAYRRFLDWRRAQRSAPLALVDTQSANEPPLARLVSDEQDQALHDALAQLDDAEREVLVLHYLQDLSYREIADLTAQPVGTIKWRTSAALKRLKRLLSPDDDHEEARTEAADRPAEEPSAAAGPIGA